LISIKIFPLFLGRGNICLFFAYGFGFPQLAQKLPLFSCPQEQVHLPLSAAGFGLPQPWQKLPLLPV
jgi:hypothetical protein